MNLLNQALATLRKTPISYEQYASQNVGFGGVAQNSYNAPITVSNAIAQPLSNRLYKDYGLDFQKRYMRFFLSSNALALENSNASPDRITYEGTTWIVVSVKQWYLYDGWNEIIAIAEKDYNK